MKKEKERALRVQIVDVGEPMVTAVGVDTDHSGRLFEASRLCRLDEV